MKRPGPDRGPGRFCICQLHKGGSAAGIRTRYPAAIGLYWLYCTASSRRGCVDRENGVTTSEPTAREVVSRFIAEQAATASDANAAAKAACTLLRISAQLAHFFGSDGR